MTIFDWLHTLLRWILAGVFIYAGSVKLLDPHTFAVLIGAYGILPESLLMPVSVGLPALELAAGIGMLFHMKGSLAAIGVLLGLFIVILGYGIWMGLDVECGCFGPDNPEGAAFHGLRTSLVRDLFLLAGVAAMCAWRRYRPDRAQRATSKI